MSFEHLNKAQIDELALMLGQEFPEFINTFIVSSEGLINSLKQQLKGGDCAGFVISIHSLKGSCRNIGAERLSNYCLIVETSAKEDSISVINPDLPEICQEFEILRASLEQLARN